MSKILETIELFKEPCPCGMKHVTAVRDVRIGQGIVHEVGKILSANDFPHTILLVVDQNTLKAADGIVESLAGFEIEYLMFDNIRVATLAHTEEIRTRIHGRDIAILAVGTGSVHDPCRYAAALEDKLLCVFGTAPSMDGFASYGAPLVERGFKSSYPAKSPEVIIADTRILAESPAYLKSSGFGDMIAKYVGLVDWQISACLTDEIYCERVAKLTRDAVDTLMNLADRVTENDPETAGQIFESLLMTGIGMSFMQNSRPASGSEHIVAHLIECKELPFGIIPNYHGEDVGVSTLAVMRLYEKLASYKRIKAKKESVDFEDVYQYYGEMADDVRALNEPTTITDQVCPSLLEEKWPQICEIIRSVPSADECYDAMKRAGCKTTVAEIGKSQEFFDECMHYSPYMRRRLTLLRMLDMIEPID